VVPLWPAGAPPGDSRPDLQETIEQKENNIRINAVSNPSMILVPPPDGVPPSGVALLLCPGGGYGTLGTGEIVKEAGWLNAMGATAVLLKYRVPPRPEDREHRRLPLQDAQRAMGILRSRAAEWKLDPGKIGIGGFSAGGHLAMNLAMHAKERAYNPVDDHDKAGCRPDFVVLHYPAYLTKPIESLTPNPNLELDAAADRDFPPVFIAITRPDKFTIGCVNTLWTLQKAGVPVELHVYPVGGHGGSFDKYPQVEFARPLARFLKDHGILDKKAQAAGDAWLDKRAAAVRKQLVEKSGIPAPKPPAPAGEIKGVEASKLTVGDREILKCVDGSRPVLPLWHGEGVRKDDPLKPGEEQMGAKKDGILRVGRVTRPTMMIFAPEKPNGGAVVVFPGGGYSILASDHEGVKVAEWLNANGITAFLVKYRVPRRKGLEKHAVPLQDAQRAVRLVRSQAGRFGVDPGRIGVLGFSAGGHLATMACLQHEKAAYEGVDDHDKQKCRPDFGVLIYPAYLTTKTTGAELDPLLAEPLRNRTPPLYIAIAANDRFMTGALRFLLKAREGRVPVECHVYEKGGHGQGLKPSGYPFSEWGRSCARWLRDVNDGIVVK
jgi:acetyl esterase/lipase